MKHIHKKWLLRINNAAMWVGGISFIGYKITDSDVFHSLLMISAPVYIACGIYFMIRDFIIVRSIWEFFVKYIYVFFVCLIMGVIVLGVSLK